MDQARSPEGRRTTRWILWIVASVVLAGLIAAGIIAVNGDRPGSAVVSAAGDRTGTVDVTSTVTVLLSPTSTPATTVPGSTTLPKAAVDVLNAIGGSTTTTRPRATTTTRPPAPAPTTTVPTSTTVAPTTTTTLGRFTATLVNNHPQAVVVIVNGQQFPLAPAQTLDVELPISPRGDLVQVRLAANASCGVGDSGEIFKPGGRYRVAVVVGQTMCSDFTTPLLDIDPV